MKEESKIGKDKQVSKVVETKINDDIDSEIKVKTESIEENEEIDYCEKVFVIPKYKKDKRNIDIEREIDTKLGEKGIKIRRIFVERAGHPDFGEYNRSIVLIEAFDRTAMLLSFICQIIEFSPNIEGLGLEISLVLV